MKIVIFLVLLLTGNILFALSQTNYAGFVIQDNSIGTVNWSGGNPPANAVGAPDEVYAVSGNLDNTTNRYLYATNYGFNIPINAIIAGIVVSPTRHASSAADASYDASIRLITNGIINIANRAATNFYTTTDVTFDHGSSTDTWDVVLSPNIVNSAGFGTVFAAYKIAAGGGVTISVDSIRIIVYYTLHVRKAMAQTVH